MANIKFNNTTYQIDDSTLAPATSALRTHLSTTMSGTGATINFGGTTYNIDQTKLQAATNDFTTHLGTIAGNGTKVKIGNTEYSIDSTKLTTAISELEAVLSGTGEERLEGDGAEYYTLAPTALSFRSTAPLNELQDVQINGVTVDPSNYTLEEGSTIVAFPIDYLKTLNIGSYEVAVVSDSKTVKGDFQVKAPELNEYGFYYNQPYTAYVESLGGKIVFFNREDGILDIINVAANYIETATYTVNGKNAIMNTSMGTFTGTYSDDGMSVYCNELQVTASLGDESVVADEDYIYIYKEDLCGYEVSAIDKTKAEYGKIKTSLYNRSVVSIAINAFTNNINLVSMPTQESTAWTPSVIKIINESAFSGCSNLRKVVIPNSTRTIAYKAFSNCVNVEDLHFANVEDIGDEAFSGCINLTEVIIPTETKYVGQGAFRNCSSLTNVVIALRSSSYGNLTIYAEAFADCTSLANIIFNGTMAEWNSIAKGDNWNYNVPATYVQCSDGQVSLV